MPQDVKQTDENPDILLIINELRLQIGHLVMRIERLESAQGITPPRELTDCFTTISVDPKIVFARKNGD